MALRTLGLALSRMSLAPALPRGKAAGDLGAHEGVAAADAQDRPRQEEEEEQEPAGEEGLREGRGAQDAH